MRIVRVLGGGLSALFVIGAATALEIWRNDSYERYLPAKSKTSAGRAPEPLGQQS
jgi:hypothetical protein